MVLMTSYKGENGQCTNKLKIYIVTYGHEEIFVAAYQKARDAIKRCGKNKSLTVQEVDVL